jgi:hypothetical protein
VVIANLSCSWALENACYPRRTFYCCFCPEDVDEEEVGRTDIDDNEDEDEDNNRGERSSLSS